MTSPKLAILTALVTVLLTLALQSHLHQGRHEEVARLRFDNRQLQLKLGQQRQAQLARTKNDGAKGGTGPQANSSAQPDEAAKSDGRKMPLMETSVASGTEYRNEGMGTPLAALQTLAWACDHADAAVMEKLLIYDEDARRKTLEHFAEQTAGHPAELPSPEAAAAALYIEDGMNHPYPGSKIMELARFEQLRPGRVLLHLPDANGDGYEFQETPEGWKLAVTMRIVDNYIKESAERAKTGH